jgi:hypothetical protein
MNENCIERTQHMNVNICMPLIKENQYLVNTGIWLPWSSKVVPAPIDPHSVPAPPPAPLAPVNDFENLYHESQYSSRIWRIRCEQRETKIQKLEQDIKKVLETNTELYNVIQQQQQEITNLTLKNDRLTQEIIRKPNTRKNRFQRNYT